MFMATAVYSITLVCNLYTLFSGVGLSMKVSEGIIFFSIADYSITLVHNSYWSLMYFYNSGIALCLNAFVCINCNKHWKFYVHAKWCRVGHWASLLQAFEDVNLYKNVELQLALYWLNIIFAVIFAVEMFIKWIAFGYKKYFTSFWCLLDFAIVVVSSADKQP